jgi:hypothetical protein
MGPPKNVPARPPMVPVTFEYFPPSPSALASRLPPRLERAEVGVKLARPECSEPTVEPESPSAEPMSKAMPGLKSGVEKPF